MNEDVACRVDDLTKAAEEQVWQKLLLAILNGQTRYAHINALRQDRVSAEVLNVAKIVSEDSVRRAFLKGPEAAWGVWLRQHERAVWEPLLTEAYVLDIDNTIKPLYGHQEGAELGHNPQKPGRPSHNYHTYFIGSLRLVLGVEVHGGKQHAGRYSMPGLWALVDGLPAVCRPRLIRGDVSYGNERIPSVSGSGRLRECLRRDQEPVGLGRVRDAGLAPLSDHGSVDCVGLQLVEHLYSAGATGSAPGGGHVAAFAAARRGPVGHHRPPQDRAADIDSCSGR
jgi:hypothetical protein